VPLPDDAKFFRFKFEQNGLYDPTSMPRADTEHWIRQEFDQALREFFVQTEEWASKRGYKKTTARREYLHFEWLVRFQVLNAEAAEIARASSRSADAVRTALRDLGSAIGLTLRAARRGRPRKKSGERARRT
jgi:hypothetical protein